MTEEPLLLKYQKVNQPFMLRTDASQLGLGLILKQRDEQENYHPIAYASRPLTSDEKRYSITELEMLAIYWALNNFRHYLLGHDV